MADNNGVILFLTEGKKPDKAVMKSVARAFFDKSQCDVKFLGLNIYALYQKLREYINEDDALEVDTFSVLKEICSNVNSEDAKSLFLLDREEIFQIFLFFDYDGHTNEATSEEDKGFDIVVEMLKYFDDESDKGKLYVNYPMIESCKYLIGAELPIHNISNGSAFKTEVNTAWEKAIKQNLSKLTKTDWAKFFARHLSVANYLVTDTFIYPNAPILIDAYSQLNLIRQQNLKFIQPEQQILVLSSVSLFLCEYFREDLIEEWRKYV